MFTVKEVVMSAEEAIREVARLNALCSDRTSTRYFWSGTHLFRDGGSFGSASYGYDADQPGVATDAAEPAAAERLLATRLEMPLRGTLVLAILNVKSSYIAETEEPLSGSDDVPDTLQWWIASDQSFRIKTFAVDHDIHIHGLTEGGPSIVDMAVANNSENYGDVIAQQHVIELQDCNDAAAVARAFSRVGLPSSLEVEPGQFAFWKPDEAEYKTQSRPK